MGNSASSPGGEFAATVTQMGRSYVQVQVGAHEAVEREPARAVHLALAMPANDRMDWLVEKATELGVASVQPLMSERSVLRLSGERADKIGAGGQRSPNWLPGLAGGAALAAMSGSCTRAGSTAVAFFA